MRRRGRSPHFVWRCVLAGGLLHGAGEGARAGAFLQQKGGALIITSSSFDVSDTFFDAHGRVRRVSDYRKFDMQTYAEYGATDWLTLIFASSATQSIGLVGDALATDRYGRVEGGVRLRLWTTGAHVFSAQAVYRYAYPIAYVGAPGLRVETSEADARLLYGYSFHLFKRPAFVSAETGWRTRIGLGGEGRGDVTLGWRPWPRLLLLAQSFNAFRMNTKSFAPVPQPLRSHKLQMSAVFDITPRWSIQAGAYATLAGSNARAERGVIGGIWRRF